MRIRQIAEKVGLLAAFLILTLKKEHLSSLNQLIHINALNPLQGTSEQNLCHQPLAIETLTDICHVENSAEDCALSQHSTNYQEFFEQIDYIRKSLVSLLSQDQFKLLFFPKPIKSMPITHLKKEMSEFNELGRRRWASIIKNENNAEERKQLEKLKNQWDVLYAQLDPTLWEYLDNPEYYRLIRPIAKEEIHYLKIISKLHIKNKDIPRQRVTSSITDLANRAYSLPYYENRLNAIYEQYISFNESSPNHQRKEILFKLLVEVLKETQEFLELKTPFKWAYEKLYSQTDSKHNLIDLFDGWRMSNFKTDDYIPQSQTQFIEGLSELEKKFIQISHQMKQEENKLEKKEIIIEQKVITDNTALKQDIREITNDIYSDLCVLKIDDLRYITTEDSGSVGKILIDIESRIHLLETYQGGSYFKNIRETVNQLDKLKNIKWVRYHEYFNTIHNKIEKLKQKLEPTNPMIEELLEKQDKYKCMMPEFEKVIVEVKDFIDFLQGRNSEIEVTLYGNKLEQDNELLIEAMGNLYGQQRNLIKKLITKMNFSTYSAIRDLMQDAQVKIGRLGTYENKEIFNKAEELFNVFENILKYANDVSSYEDSNKDLLKTRENTEQLLKTMLKKQLKSNTVSEFPVKFQDLVNKVTLIHKALYYLYPVDNAVYPALELKTIKDLKAAVSALRYKCMDGTESSSLWSSLWNTLYPELTKLISNPEHYQEIIPLSEQDIEFLKEMSNYINNKKATKNFSTLSFLARLTDSYYDFSFYHKMRLDKLYQQFTNLSNSIEDSQRKEILFRLFTEDFERVGAFLIKVSLYNKIYLPMVDFPISSHLVVDFTTFSYNFDKTQTERYYELKQAYEAIQNDLSRVNEREIVRDENPEEMAPRREINAKIDSIYHDMDILKNLISGVAYDNPELFTDIELGISLLKTYREASHFKNTKHLAEQFEKSVRMFNNHRNLNNLEVDNPKVETALLRYESKIKELKSQLNQYKKLRWKEISFYEISFFMLCLLSIVKYTDRKLKNNHKHLSDSPQKEEDPLIDLWNKLLKSYNAWNISQGWSHLSNNSESSMNNTLLSQAKNHFDEVIEPAFKGAFEAYGDNLQECLTKIEVNIRRFILGVIQEQATTENNQAIIDFITQYREQLSLGDPKALDLARPLFNSNTIVSQIAWRCYDHGAPNLGWDNLFVPPSPESAGVTIFTLALTGNKLTLQEGTDIIRKQAAYYFLMAQASGNKDIQLDFINYLAAVRRSHNETEEGVDSPSCFPGTLTRLACITEKDPEYQWLKDKYLLLEDVFAECVMKKLDSVFSTLKYEEGFVLSDSITSFIGENIYKVLNGEKSETTYENIPYNEEYRKKREDFIQQLTNNDFKAFVEEVKSKLPKEVAFNSKELKASVQLLLDCLFTSSVNERIGGMFHKHFSGSESEREIRTALLKAVKKSSNTFDTAYKLNVDKLEKLKQSDNASKKIKALEGIINELKLKRNLFNDIEQGITKTYLLQEIEGAVRTLFGFPQDKRKIIFDQWEQRLESYSASNLNKQGFFSPTIDIPTVDVEESIQELRENKLLQEQWFLIKELLRKEEYKFLLGLESEVSPDSNLIHKSCPSLQPKLET